jgi:hypothetical protein
VTGLRFTTEAARRVVCRVPATHPTAAASP